MSSHIRNLHNIGILAFMKNMRIARSLQLNDTTGYVHMIWRCHNKEFYLLSPRIKDLYMRTISEALQKKNYKSTIQVHSFCVMNNHFHQTTTYKENSTELSNYMRSAHGSFGLKYNKLNNRSGKVAESRPKTSLVENVEHEMRVHFYVEANPIRAGIYKFENLKLYKYSSFRFYAYGIEDENTPLLTFPTWYLELGSSPQERQTEYRRLFREYLEIYGDHKAETHLYKRPYIGSLLWVIRQENKIQTRNYIFSSA